MKLLLSLAAIAALAAAPSARAFDNADCKRFLAGTWSGSSEQEMGGKTMSISTLSTYRADGTFSSVVTLTGAEGPPREEKLDGSWDAAPGEAAGSCVATVTAEALGGSQSLTLIVLDENTVRNVAGAVSRRVKG